MAVVCELVSTCNLSCSMCYTIQEEFQEKIVGTTRMLPWPVVKSVIDECADLKVPSMLFSWRGESTLYRSKDEKGNLITFPDVLKYARKKEILEVTSLTHGQKIDEEMAQKIVDAEKFNQVGISMEIQEFEHPVYPQLFGRFVPFLSSIDAFMNCGPNLKDIIRSH